MRICVGLQSSTPACGSVNDRLQFAAVVQRAIGFDGHVDGWRDVSSCPELEAMPACGQIQSSGLTSNIFDRPNIEAVDVDLRSRRSDIKMKCPVCGLRTLRSWQRHHRLNQRRFGWRHDWSRWGRRDVPRRDLLYPVCPGCRCRSSPTTRDTGRFAPACRVWQTAACRVGSGMRFRECLVGWAHSGEERLHRRHRARLKCRCLDSNPIAAPMQKMERSRWREPE